MKTAIVYYSMSGNTKYVADKIADGIKNTGEAELILIDPKDKVKEEDDEKIAEFCSMLM